MATMDAIAAEDVSTLFVERVPIAFARRFGVLGLAQRNGCLPVAIRSEESLAALSKITALLGLAAEPVLAAGSRT